MSPAKFSLPLIIILFLALIGYNLYISKNVSTAPVTNSQNQVASTSTNTATSTTQLANPASENCIEKGGSLQIQTKEDGSQYGLCYFDDARACEEWAMFRGECQVGGVKTTGYDTVDQKFCAWSGGRTFAVENSQCTFPSGKVCPTIDFYNGTCIR
jgi:putative hemolysin